VSTSHPHQSVFTSHLQQSLPYRSQIDTLSDEQAKQLSDDMIENSCDDMKMGMISMTQNWLETNNLVSTTPNSIIENFVDVLVLNPISVTNFENITLSVVSVASNISASKSPLPSKGLPTNEKQLCIIKPLEKFVSPFTSKQSSKSTTHADPTARVLTSKECLGIIKEKQMKRRLKKKKNQRRKKEREEKKKSKEEKLKKTLQKAQKAAERAEKVKKAA